MKRILFAVAIGALVGCSSSSSGTGTSTSGSIGGGTGSSGSSGSSGSTGPACSGIDLEASGALDLNLVGSQLVHLTGHVTLNQATLPTASSSRGELVFAGAAGASYTYPLQTSGDITYQLDVLPDTYTVSFAGNPALCGSNSTMPCNGGVLREGVVVGQGGGALDIDIPSVQASGNVIVNGNAMPAAQGSRGSISFQLSGSKQPAISKSFGASGAASYKLALLPGTYDVLFVGNPQLCGSATPPGVPCNSATLRTGVVLQSSGALDIDVGAVQVSGHVTINGGAIPVLSAGSVVFTGSDGAAVSSGGLGSSQNQYALTLVPGVYDVSWVASPQACSGSTPTAAPCNGGMLKSGVNLSSSGALDLDVATVQVSGNVTVNGQAMPSASSSRGALTFRATGSASSPTSASTQSFGTSGGARYALSLVAGTYDIVYVANPNLCAPQQTLPGVPCNGGVIRSGVALASSGALDVDLPVVQASGKVTLNGAALPSANGPRGAIAFVGADGSALSAGDLGQSGPGQYALSLLAGTYDVTYVADAALCGQSQPSAFPCTGATLRSALALTQTGALDVDIRAIQITGNVTLDNQPMPSASSNRGSIDFTSEPGRDSIALPLQPSGTAQYSVTLVPGRYAVSYTNQPSLCGTSNFPCLPELLLGCP